jgi:hypothetical protein
MKLHTLVLVACIGGGACPAGAQTGSAKPGSALVSSCDYPGATPDAQIAAAIAALPRTGGVVDDRCHSGPQTWKANPFGGVQGAFKPVTLLLGSGTITIDSAGTIAICTSCHLQGVSRDATLFKIGRDFPADTPVFTMGDHNPSFDVILSQFGVSTEGKPGVTAIYNSKSQERSSVSDVSIYGLNGGVGVDIETSGAQNSGPYEKLDIGSTPSAPPSTIGIRNRGATTRAIRGITVNGGAQIAHGIEIGPGGRSLIEDYHCENTADCVYLDGTSGAVIIGVYGSDNVRTPDVNAVHISPNNVNVFLMDIDRGARGVSNVLDETNGISETRAEGLGWYATGLSGGRGAPSQSVFSSSPDISNYSKLFKFLPATSLPPCASAGDVGKTVLLARGAPALLGYCTATNSGFSLLWTQMEGERDQLSQSGTVALDTSQGSLQYVTLTGNSSGTINNGSAGGQQVTVQVCNGSGNFAWSWPANIRGGGAVNTGPNRCQSQTFTWNGAVRAWIPVGQITAPF